ncbi:unnamed protein product [Protopolystoma xenopodis]|uniref:Uncharacterized protein n=1 Tax=Protopolystoma xenopodis TaxID=117903 RepID=A0A3S5CBH2_9PLAT|nr:unnamed protein product [Protopolystoma xenopodis]
MPINHNPGSSMTGFDLGAANPVPPGCHMTRLGLASSGAIHASHSGFGQSPSFSGVSGNQGFAPVNAFSSASPVPSTTMVISSNSPLSSIDLQGGSSLLKRQQQHQQLQLHLQQQHHPLSVSQGVIQMGSSQPASFHRQYHSQPSHSNQSPQLLRHAGHKQTEQNHQLTQQYQQQHYHQHSQQSLPLSGFICGQHEMPPSHLTTVTGPNYSQTRFSSSNFPPPLTSSVSSVSSLSSFSSPPTSAELLIRLAPAPAAPLSLPSSITSIPVSSLSSSLLGAGVNVRPSQLIISPAVSLHSADQDRVTINHCLQHLDLRCGDFWSTL